jgi:His/Glu/Gln/Arg/opine family amino acid ABC transporter permease subunit
LTSAAPQIGREPGLAWWRLSTGAALTLIVMGAVIAAMVSGNLAFLEDSTYWQLGFSVVPQAPSDPYWKTMGVAVLNTVVLAAVAIVVATVAGAAFAFIAIAGNPAWSRIASGYVQFFRNMPLILQALFWFAVISHMPGPRQALRFAGVVVSNRGVSTPFFTPPGLAAVGAAFVSAAALLWILRRTRPFQRGRTVIVLGGAALAAVATWGLFFPGQPIWSVPELTGFNFTGGVHLPTELISILIALSMFGSAYVAEIVRGGFETVPKGVIEAARALALPAWAVEAKVRVPLALRAIILPLGSQYTTLIKATSIGLAIGFTDLFAVTLMSINQSGHTIALLCVMTACFVLLNQAVVSAANALNHAFELPGTASR